MRFKTENEARLSVREARAAHAALLEVIDRDAVPEELENDTYALATRLSHFVEFELERGDDE